ncbi:hypothetical protein [Burkholderia cepacia]|uniref:hypothetical protein n=1 Tax=Burkholderia cepacia TaxID=292 RepID=UPI0012D97658|nr:hypothetical protein [Burkholderia cepacia]
MEIVKALPDKADRRQTVRISNSPDYFLPSANEVAHGGPSANALLLVGTFVGICGQSEHAKPAQL